MTKKYVVFKDDDAGKDTPKLKKWINVVLENDAKAAIGLIGKHMEDEELRKYLNSLDKKRIEIFCHGYSHSHFPYIVMKFLGRNRFFPTEFDRNANHHRSSLKKYRMVENRYLGITAITFGPQGNIWNESLIEPLEQNGFKIMFSWEKVKGKLFTIPLSDNLKQKSLDEFIEDYEKNKDKKIYTLQFHHAKLSDQQFDLMKEVIDFLKKEGRIFVTPSELLKLVDK